MPSLADLMTEDRRAKLAREMTHETYSPYPPTVALREGILNWGRGVRERSSPLGMLNALAKIAQESKDDPLATALNWSNPMSGPLSGLVGMFAGKGAKTANLSALIKAEGMAKQGIPDAQIWKETGWTLDTPDKMPRFEIPDNAARMTGSRLPTEYIEGAGEVPAWKLTDVMKHEDLYSAYPTTKDIRSSFMNKGNSGAEYKEGLDWISYDERAYKRGLRTPEQQLKLDRLDAETDAFYTRPDVKAYYKAMDNHDFNLPEEEFYKTYNKLNGKEIDAEASRLAQQSISSRKEAGAGYSLGKGENEKSITLHELQHAIQQREGFARGGSPAQMEAQIAATKSGLIASAKNIDVNQAMKELAGDANYQGIPQNESLAIARALQKKGYQVSANEVPALLQSQELKGINSEYEAYKRLAGEAEARLTQARMNMTPEQRLAQYPYQPEYFQKETGVPLKDLIVRKDGGMAMNITPKDLQGWVNDYKAMRDAGNIKGAKLAKKNIDAQIATHGFNPNDVYGADPDLISVANRYGDTAMSTKTISPFDGERRLYAMRQQNGKWKPVYSDGSPIEISPEFNDGGAAANWLRNNQDKFQQVSQ